MVAPETLLRALAAACGLRIDLATYPPLLVCIGITSHAFVEPRVHNQSVP